MVWEGPSIEWDSALTLPDLADRNARERPDDIILIDAATGREMTNAGLAAAYAKAARGLAAAGFGRGDCLCTLMPNDFAWYVGALAAQSLGGTISGVNPLATPDEIHRQFSRIPAKALLSAAQLAERAKQIAGAAGIPIVVAIGANDADIPTLADIDGPELARQPACFAEDPALFPFSSGTTGLPKAVVVTHRNLVAGGHQMPPALRFAPGDRFLGLAPLFHIVGPSLFVSAMVTGGAVVVVSRFDPELALDAIERHAVTHAPLMSPIVRALARHPSVDHRNFSRLKAVIASGAPLSRVDQAAASERFGCAVIQVYGMTETSSGITADDISAPTPGTVGPPVPLMKIRIVDADTGVPQPAGTDGEIQLAGPNVFAGYLGYPDETAKVMTEDGWLRTGDIGAMDGDGKLRITGRIKELIKVNSGQVAPAELEMVLCEHPAIADAAVIGRPNRFTGEVPVAFIVLRAPMDPFEIMDWVNERVIHYKRIRAIEIVETLPRNPLGKLDRKALAVLDQKRIEPDAPVAA